MKKYLIYFTILVFTASCAHQEYRDSITLNPVESFEGSDCPIEYQYDSLKFIGPWGYNKSENASRKYPLLVSGCWGEGANQYSSYAQIYPAFVLDYQKNTESDGKILGQWIKDAIESGYRIDSNRIYLTGFSKGGSGSFPLAKGMNNAGLFFAAIVRVAGQSQYDLGNEIVEKTAIWYHIGLSDTSMRIDVARKTLECVRNYTCNKDAIETTNSDHITGFERNTITIKRFGNPMFIYSEYTGMDHTSSPCYEDKSIFPWMFSNSLEYRKCNPATASN